MYNEFIIKPSHSNYKTEAAEKDRIVITALADNKPLLPPDEDELILESDQSALPDSNAGPIGVGKSKRRRQQQVCDDSTYRSYGQPDVLVRVSVRYLSTQQASSDSPRTLLHRRRLPLGRL
jgi:hypothetical protein